ncbi:MSCRAMM family protein [Deinococcus ruber]|uniref:Prepilin-type N-terminal cleavage/methylation domain-containing protein n=1 Tax=Deinococcus ruber TaxID=1848197 RepID=A0A918F6Q0_9DEIO|nr:prepilin-type N-terminal cleavage/methylation domain-containing protein [Deinococcus ruber]GGR09990.1 hypothetical protein GCM10008957_23460 [Deinococcus ruber]
MPAPNSPPLARHVSGFTLIEMLVSLLVLGVVFALIAQVLPYGTQRTISDIKASEQQVSSTQLAAALSHDFASQGQFAGFVNATESAFTAVFQNSEPYPVAPAADFANSETLTVPGLQATVGDHLLIVSPDGSAKLLKITAQQGTSFTHNGCVNGVGAAQLQVFKANVLQVQASGNDVLRGLNDSPLVKAGEGVMLGFQYVYRDTSGALLVNPTGAPQNVSAVGAQLAYLRVGVTRERSGSANAVPLDPGHLRHLLDCGTSLLGSGVDDRLKVTVSGLPAGVDADVTTSGPNLNAVTPVTTIYPVSQGTFNVTARPVTVGGVTYTPVVQGAPISMQGRAQRAFASVTYTAPPAAPATATTGTLHINVTGLNGQSALATLSGTTSYSTYLTDGMVAIQNLPTGGYVLSPQGVGTTTPLRTSISFTVTAGNTTVVNVAYTSPTAPVAPAPTADVGNLTINVVGLDGNHAPGLLSGPYSTSLTLANGSIKINNLPVGSYILTPQPVSYYVAQQPTYVFSIQKNQNQSVLVQYNSIQPKGSITLVVIGLPDQVNTGVGVSGPSGALALKMNMTNTSRPVTSEQLPAGNYSIIAPTMVNANGIAVSPGFTPGQTFTLQKDQSLRVIVDYSGSVSATPANGGNNGSTCQAGWTYEQCAANGYNVGAGDPNHPHDPTFCAANPGYPNCGSGGTPPPPPTCRPGNDAC